MWVTLGIFSPFKIYGESISTKYEKSLFLIFEDGRTDTAIFSQKITEEYNYKSTILTYADKFEKEDPKFLKPDELKEMEESTYWELGTNGYRLEYINVFDKEHKFLGRMTSLDFSEVASNIRRDIITI